MSDPRALPPSAGPQRRTSRGDEDGRRRIRLHRLLARAAAAPYYGAILGELGIEHSAENRGYELRDLPFLDRQVVARHGLDAFLTAGRAGLFSVTTSGSTGTPGRFLRSGREEAEFSARWRRVYAAWGCSAFDSQVNVAVASNRIKPPRAVFRTAELGVIAWSCPARRSLLHLNDDALAVEVVGPDGAPLLVGPWGSWW